MVASGLIFTPDAAWLFPALKMCVSGMALLILGRLLIGHHVTGIRVQAELVRACLPQMTARCPIIAKPESQLAHSESGLRTLVMGLRLADLWENEPANPIRGFQACADRYKSCRVEDQLIYFDRNAWKAKPWLRLLNVTYRSALVLVFVVSSCYFFYTILSQGGGEVEGAPDQGEVASVNEKTHDSKGAEVASAKGASTKKKVLFYLVPVTLAGLGTFCMATISVQELGRRYARYGDAAAGLCRQRRRLENARTASNVILIMRETEEYLAEEVYGWRNYSLFVNTH